MPRPPRRSISARENSRLESLRLSDRLRPGARILFVGINPGVRSATTGHHFAGHSNRFWKLLWESGLTPVFLTAEHDDRLLEWGYGITNLVPRPTPGIATLRPEEYVAGLKILRRKVRRFAPDIVAFVGVTLFRFVFGTRSGVPVTLGLQDETFEGSTVFVLPNPSGRNAHFSYSEMLAAFRGLTSDVSSLLTPLPSHDG